MCPMAKRWQNSHCVTMVNEIGPGSNYNDSGMEYDDEQKELRLF
jgi:hypothetical protein